MNEQTLQWILSVPLFSTGLVLLSPLIYPTSRWSRQLRNDLQILKDLPEGFEHDELERSVLKLAGQIREYRRMSPFEKGATWTIAAVTFGAHVATVVYGFNPSNFAVMDWIFTAVGFIAGSVIMIAAPLGRSFLLYTAKDMNQMNHKLRATNPPSPTTEESTT